MKIKCFSSLTVHNCILTWDTLKKKGFIAPNRCILCKLASEHCSHLFFNAPLLLLFRWRHHICWVYSLLEMNLPFLCASCPGINVLLVTRLFHYMFCGGYRRLRMILSLKENFPIQTRLPLKLLPSSWSLDLGSLWPPPNLFPCLICMVSFPFVILMGFIWVAYVVVDYA